MSEPLSFFLPGPRYSYREKRRTLEGHHPTPKNSKRARMLPNGQPTVCDSPKTNAAHKALVKALLPPAPPTPFTAVRLDVTFRFVPPAKPEWKHQAALEGFIPCVAGGRGDRDNLHKLLADALTAAGFYVDDAVIAEGEVAKGWGVVAGFDLAFTPLPTVTTKAEWLRARDARARAFQSLG